MALLIRLLVVLVIVAIIVWLWRVALVMAIAIGALAAGAYLLDRWRTWRAVRWFRATWSSQGKDLLLVYSNSPHWQAYVEDVWLHRWGQRAVVLNWSERRIWGRSRRAEVALFRTVAGVREFNPLAIIVPPAGSRVRVVRFWRAFRDYKHGKTRLLREAEADVDKWLGAKAQQI